MAENFKICCQVSLGGLDSKVLIKDLVGVDVSLGEILQSLNGCGFSNPKSLDFTPVLSSFESRLNILNWPKNWLIINQILSVFKEDHNFSPYMQIPGWLWEETVRSDLTSEDLGLVVGKLAIYSGEERVFEFSEDPRIEFIYGLYEKILEKHFDPEINRPVIEIVSDVDFLGKTIWVREKDKIKTTIQLSDKIVDSNEKILEQVLTHELVHHYLYHKYDGQVADHGELFDLIADDINEIEGDNYVAENGNETVFVEEISGLEEA